MEAVGCWICISLSKTDPSLQDVHQPFQELEKKDPVRVPKASETSWMKDGFI